MKLILTHDVERLGQAGEVVTVKDGYGRNYLLPQGYATLWTKGAQKQIDDIAESRRRRAIATLEEAQALRDQLQEGVIEIARKAGENGRLFGAVTTRDVAAAASELTGKSVDRRTINLDSTIKSIGAYTAKVKLADDVVASLRISVTALR